jgi:hypothetical protein
MPWTYAITATQQNPVPYDVRYVTVAFTDGVRTFTRTLKFIADNFPTQQSIDDFLTAKCLALADFDTDIVLAANAPINSISNAQFRIWLLRRGSFTSINNAMVALGATSELFQGWQNANVFTRTSPVILAIANQLGLTGTQINNLFQAASQIEV